MGSPLNAAERRAVLLVMAQRWSSAAIRSLGATAQKNLPFPLSGRRQRIKENEKLKADLGRALLKLFPEIGELPVPEPSAFIARCRRDGRAFYQDGNATIEQRRLQSLITGEPAR